MERFSFNINWKKMTFMRVMHLGAVRLQFCQNKESEATIAAHFRLKGCHDYIDRRYDIMIDVVNQHSTFWLGTEQMTYSVIFSTFLNENDQVSCSFSVVLCNRLILSSNRSSHFLFSSKKKLWNCKVVNSIAIISQNISQIALNHHFSTTKNRCSYTKIWNCSCWWDGNVQSKRPLALCIITNSMDFTH